LILYIFIALTLRFMLVLEIAVIVEYRGLPRIRGLIHGRSRKIDVDQPLNAGHSPRQYSMGSIAMP
jgi:hypothetical protein